MDSKPQSSSLWYRLLFTAHGDLDLSWAIVGLFALIASAGCLADIFHSPEHALSWHAWTFLGGAFLSVLIAAVPVSKARILAKTARDLPKIQATVAAAAVVKETEHPNMYVDNETGGACYLTMDREHVG